MIRFKQALASARERVARLVPGRNPRRTSTREDFYRQPLQSIESMHSSISSRGAALAFAPASVPSDFSIDTPQRPTSSVPLTTLHKVPATLTITTHAAHVCKFSHGSGLLVYINGALMSAARVALKVNVATLEFVKRLPLDELGTIGVCLGAAFANDDDQVDITWAEVGDETEQDWREAEQDWKLFAGGPFEAVELEGYGEESFSRRSICQEEESVRFGQDGPVSGEEWAAFSKRHFPLRSEDSVSLCPQPGAFSSSSQDAPNAGPSRTFSSSTRDRPFMTAAEFAALPDYSESFSYHSSSSEDQDAIQLTAIKRPMTPRKSYLNPSSDKENTPLLWSPGRGNGPIMSSEEFDALPD
ncbi:hypothetical protein BU25DRAFT_448022 [Macroventuria anomochaeta]|uniref:Uncharacterized protein n=1 Tax=Macroventuria anomochaeta TaxID=301207 RepID=A0ACB6S3Q7_9PLEO|nr:uncharacterized protein BU25DRAFT_448022 [Macroventuria anomochaeta]KAF2628588.1 hypothetical protein BU25DRAFT_448022 [Macroventuria anomochaeta]